MFIIDLRNTRVSNSDFSVIGNNNVDVVHIFSHFTQYATGYKVYLKVQSIDETYVDKILIDSENISVVDNALLVKWTMGAVSTQCKKINIQLQFEEEDGTKVAQSRIVSITLTDTIDTNELFTRIYPDVLKHLQDEIDELKADSTKLYHHTVAVENLKIKENGEETLVTASNYSLEIITTSSSEIDIKAFLDYVNKRFQNSDVVSVKSFTYSDYPYGNVRGKCFFAYVFGASQLAMYSSREEEYYNLQVEWFDEDTVTYTYDTITDVVTSL